MNSIAIRVENLSKVYTIGTPQEGYKTLRDSIAEAVATPFRKIAATTRLSASRDNHHPSRASSSSPRDTIWALNDVSFEVEQGEVFGIIGRNGAGKSTLLKILSRITEPTSGRAEIYGRVGSLLEMGTGFHPELTGRENIYLSGAILGMKKAEIDRKFDEIVAFSEIAQFLDTPVKRYSSGMYVRLAFAVAAHLDPQILLVDEVLAVGDLSFQQKCLRHLRGLTERGMSILLVSHNMAAIQTACRRAILLENGTIAKNGQPLEVIEYYRQALRSNGQPTPAGRPSERSDIPGSEREVAIVGFEMFGEDGTSRREIRFGEAVRIRIDLHAYRRIEHPMINFGIKRGDGVIICNFNNWYDNFSVDYIEGLCSLEGWLPPLRLVPDYYEIHVLVWPWGGGHIEGDLTTCRPIASTTFGEFSIYGSGLNSHDGVFQLPARRWRFTRGDRVVEHAAITPISLEQAFSENVEPAKNRSEESQPGLVEPGSS